MDNKYVNFFIFTVFLIGSGVVYQKYYRPPELSPCTKGGKTVELSMRSLEEEWKFDPDIVTVKKCDNVILHIFNEDSYDHGFAIEAFGVNKRLFPKRETTIVFTASKTGSYPFYCSVACGEGHYRQTGIVKVEE